MTTESLLALCDRIELGHCGSWREQCSLAAAARRSVVPGEVMEAAKAIFAAHETCEPRDCHFLTLARFILSLAPEAAT